jgi:hypothetical protein
MDYSFKLCYCKWTPAGGGKSQTFSPAQDIETKFKLKKERNISILMHKIRIIFTVASHIFEYRDPQH